MGPLLRFHMKSQTQTIEDSEAGSVSGSHYWVYLIANKIQCAHS